MKIDIHDVDHGACAVITGPQGHRLMLDCGESLKRPWFPSVSMMGEPIQALMLMNLDEDHVADLDGIWEHCPVHALVSNPTVSAQALNSMKPEGMRSGVRKAHGLLRQFGPGFVGNWQHDLGGVRWHAFWNRYGLDFRDTNNLSLAVFVSYGPFTILFGGDMETPGWEKLMGNPLFRQCLFDVTVYVASHHGRENGKCADMFNYMKPELTVISDGNKIHDTQETRCWYAARTTGIPDVSRPSGPLLPATRKVITTRKDGTISMRVGTDGRYNVNCGRKNAPALGGLLANLLAAGNPSPLASVPRNGLLSYLGN